MIGATQSGAPTNLKTGDLPLGYSTNPTVLEARRPALIELEEHRACKWTFDGANAEVTKRRAYEIREALYIAKLHAADYPALAAAYDIFSIHIVGLGVIEARLKDSRDALLTPAALIPTHGLQPWGLSQPTTAMESADQIIDTWRAHLPSNDPVHCAQTTLPLTELKRLYVWATSQQPRLMLLVGDGFITIALREAGAEPYAWAPPPEPPLPEPDFNL